MKYADEAIEAVNKAITTAVAAREKELVKEVERLPRFSAVSIRGGKEMVLKEQVLSLLKH